MVSAEGAPGGQGAENFDGSFGAMSPRGGTGPAGSFYSPQSNAPSANAPSPGSGPGMGGVDDALLSAAKAAASKNQNSDESDQPARKRAKRARPAVKFDKSTMITKKEMDRWRGQHSELVKRRGIPDALYNALPPNY